ncbi:hypothetical protein OC835_002961 [Tilletia horrida]|uniref:FAD/NAD(P)-binding domain-containing protein n=1 Tax=Tilletia horrida TaxID=155126 RepID=A0AAN6GDS5_9BASI|nr:hypothetical protein OC835_002961 [Tilletia horrida]KAK0535221.1 hypothetical protein OC842_002387 [Tilletia horrida]KAK0566963.1 hypothetical protein OC844_000484 [Tilletia horrida]
MSSTAAVLPSRADATFIAHTFVRALQDAIPDIDKTLALIHQDGYWRDFLSLQWDHRTLHGHERLRPFLAENNKLGTKEKPALFKLQVEDGRDAISSGETPGQAGSVCITAFFTFETQLGRGRGALRLTADPQQLVANEADPNASASLWKALTIFTSLEELKGHEEPLAPERRPNGIVHKPTKHRATWLERRRREVEFEDEQPAVVIVGSGQAGLSLAARLKMLGVPALILEKHERVGDSWRKRFRQLTLHDNTQYNHMPLLPFPAFWPRFTAKDKLADFFESYASMLELNVWTGATLSETSYDDSKAQWTIRVKRNNGQERVLQPSILVQATGHSGEPNVPRFKGQENFKGKVMHSSEFVAGTDFEGKHAVVVGACNSGHDIAQDFWESDVASITLVQRSSTYILSIDSVVNVLFGSIYNEDRADKPCPSTEDCDLLFLSTPTELQMQANVALTKVIAEHDRELLEGLNKAGFKLDFGIGGSGFLMKYLKKGGGYYLDVGASSLIASGEIKLKQGQNISHFTEDALVFEDGSELKADVVVLATGYQNMRTTTRRIFGDYLADHTKDVWDLDEEGEIRTMWRDSGHPGFYFMGGNLALCRYMSKRLALRIKAKLLGLA